MPTVAQRILDYLNTHPEGADDDELAAALGLKQRQTANIVCRRFAEQNLIQRQPVGGKIRNYGLGQTLPSPKIAVAETEDRLWSWEGYVQEHVVRYLVDQGYTILHTANTATHERGKDIVAQKEERILWVSVKGYQRDTLRTPATLQAGHFFKDALFDMLAWRGVSDTADLALALPNYPRYHTLLAKVAWLLPVVRFSVLWVDESGTVSQEPLSTVTPDHSSV